MSKLNVFLDRDYLQTIYIKYSSYPRNADIILYELTALKRIQIEAIRIVTGTTQLIPVNLSYQEIG